MSPPARTERSISFMCAARMASVEPNSARNCESLRPAWPATSARPICSKGLSARSAMSAAMTFSRSLDVGAGGCGAAALRRRLDLRAMTTSHGVCWTKCKAAMMTVLGRELAREVPGAPGGGGNGLRQKLVEAPWTHKNFEGGRGCTAGGCYILPQRCRVEIRSVQQLGRAGDGFES